MGALHQLGKIKVQYVSAVNRIKIIPKNGKTYWTNSFKIVKDEVIKSK